MSRLRARVRGDLARPGGGFTVGVLTIAVPIGIAIATIANVWPAPGWAATLLMVISVVAHILWGTYGYYPRRVA